MKLERRLTAAQLASMAIAGSLLLYAGVWQIALPYHLHIRPTHSLGDFLWAARFEIALYILPLSLGGWMMYAGLPAFQRGVENTIWGEPALAKLRSQINLGVWTAIAYLTFAAAFGFVIFDLLTKFGTGHHRGSSIGGMYYFFSTPLTCLMTLRSVLRPKRIRETRVWPGDVKPLVSEHWGERSPSRQIS